MSEAKIRLKAFSATHGLKLELDTLPEADFYMPEAIKAMFAEQLTNRQTIFAYASGINKPIISYYLADSLSYMAPGLLLASIQSNAIAYAEPSKEALFAYAKTFPTRFRLTRKLVAKWLNSSDKHWFVSLYAHVYYWQNNMIQYNYTQANTYGN